MKRLFFIHTVISLPELFNELCAELIPGVERLHIVDESLLQDTIRSNHLSELTIQRLCQYIISAESAGADLIMVTCSTLGPAVDQSCLTVSIPVLRVDQPMADVAIGAGSRIGVAATLSTTLEPTTDLIYQRAKVVDKEIAVRPKLCEGAFDALISGDTARHDAIVVDGLRELMTFSDVIVLAQASMARVVRCLPEEERNVPILISPRLAIEHLAKIIQKP